jgi:hypothetical protein
MSSAEPSSIGLAEFIQQVRSEIMRSVEDVETTPLFAVDEVALTIGITVDKHAEGGLAIKVIQFGVGIERSDVHTVSVKLLPLLTIEERKLELKKEARWNEIVRTQVTATLKGLAEEPARDLA